MRLKFNEEKGHLTHCLRRKDVTALREAPTFRREPRKGFNKKKRRSALEKPELLMGGGKTGIIVFRSGTGAAGGESRNGIF